MKLEMIQYDTIEKSLNFIFDALLERIILSTDALSNTCTSAHDGCRFNISEFAGFKNPACFCSLKRPSLLYNKKITQIIIYEIEFFLHFMVLNIF